MKQGERLHLTMLLERPLKEGVTNLAKLKKDSVKTFCNEDDFEMVGRTIYVLCHNGWLKSPFNSSVTEKILKVDTTSRNLDTMRKLLEIGEAINNI